MITRAGRAGIDSAIEMPGLSYIYPVAGGYRAINDMARDIRATRDLASEYLRNKQAAASENQGRKSGTYISSTGEDRPALSEDDARAYQKKDEHNAKKEAKKKRASREPRRLRRVHLCSWRYFRPKDSRSWDRYRQWPLGRQRRRGLLHPAVDRRRLS